MPNRDGSRRITGSILQPVNLVVIRDKTIAAQYVGNWNEHADHSESYQR